MHSTSLIQTAKPRNIFSWVMQVYIHKETTTTANSVRTFEMLSKASLTLSFSSPFHTSVQVFYYNLLSPLTVCNAKKNKERIDSTFLYLAQHVPNWIMHIEYFCNWIRFRERFQSAQQFSYRWDLIKLKLMFQLFPRISEKALELNFRNDESRWLLLNLTGD